MYSKFLQILHKKLSTSIKCRHFYKTIKRPTFPSPPRPSLYSPITYKSIIASLQLACFWGGIPCSYNSNIHRLIITQKSILRWKIVTLVQFLNLCYFSGVVIHLVFNLMKSDYSQLFGVTSAFMTTLLVTPTFILQVYIGGWRRVEFCTFVNQSISYSSYLKGLHNSR